MEEVWIENLKETIENSGRQHQIMIWGASYKSDEIVSVLRSWGFTIVGYIDRNAGNISEYDGCPVYGIEKLRESGYFIFVALEWTHDSVLTQLNEAGYTEFQDFWYPKRTIRLDGTQDYQDLYGNRLTTENTSPICVRLRNSGVVEIKTRKLNEITVVSQEKSLVKIGERVKFGKDVAIAGRAGRIFIGDDCWLKDAVKVGTKCGEIYVGRGCTVESWNIFSASFGAKIVLGEDCMLSHFVFIRAGNAHNIIDLNTMENLDDNTKRDVILGEHVWVGMRATLMNGVEIGDGSTVGANTFVCKRNFPKNCCIAGNPVAKIIRERTAWLRDEFEIHKDIEDYQEFIYDE